ncbi:TolC family protein [Sphingomonas sp. TX0543]|uniref:TolC family protein n=1 Tax=Sphingomonas sp. TX0543 TaxID=3399682 RepID=UPI003AFAB845
MPVDHPCAPALARRSAHPPVIRPRRLIGLGCVAALLASSCATAPSTPVQPQGTGAAFRARSLDDPGLAALAAHAGFPAWPPERLDGHALSLVALENGQAVQLARAKWRVAQAAVLTAGQRPNPTLSLNPVYATATAPGAIPWLLAATLVQLMETGGKRPLRVEAARYRAEAARLDLLSTGRQATQTVDSLLLDLSAAQARLAALDAQVTAYAGLVEAAEKKLRVGEDSSVALMAARATLRRTQLDAQATAAMQADTLHQLAIAIGLPAERLLMSRLALPRLDAGLSPGFITRARDAAPLNRADLLARLADYAAADADLRLQLAGRTPNIEAGPSFEYDQGEKKWGVTLAASLPVFNANGGPIAEARAVRTQAERQFTTAQAAVIGEVDRAAEAYAQAVRSLGVAERLYAEQERRARAVETMFARGEIDRVELLTARAELAAQVTGGADARGAVAKAALALQAAAHLRPDGFDPVPLILSEGER